MVRNVENESVNSCIVTGMAVGVGMKLPAKREFVLSFIMEWDFIGTGIQSW